MPGGGNLGALNVAFRQRSTTVRATVADGIISSLDIEEGDSLAFQVEGAAAWPGVRSFLSVILISFGIVLESV